MRWLPSLTTSAKKSWRCVESTVRDAMMRDFHLPRRRGRGRRADRCSAAADQPRSHPAGPRAVVRVRHARTGRPRSLCIDRRSVTACVVTGPFPVARNASAREILMDLGQGVTLLRANGVVQRRTSMHPYGAQPTSFAVKLRRARGPDDLRPARDSNRGEVSRYYRFESPAESNESRSATANRLARGPVSDEIDSARAVNSVSACCRATLRSPSTSEPDLEIDGEPTTVRGEVHPCPV